MYIFLRSIYQQSLIAEFILEGGFPSKTGNSCDRFPSGISMKKKPSDGKPEKIGDPPSQSLLNVTSRNPS
jgi:hypothetical protein